MKLIDYINQANPQNVEKLYIENYTEKDGWYSAEAFIKFRNVLNSTIGIRMGEDQFKVVIEHVVQDWSKIGSGTLKEIDEYFAVGGKTPKEPDTVYSLGFTPWGEWREMEVEDISGKNLSLDEIATHIYYEMTWYGWPEQNKKFRDELYDSAEKCDRDFANWKSGDALPEGYTELKPKDFE